MRPLSAFAFLAAVACAHAQSLPSARDVLSQLRSTRETDATTQPPDSFYKKKVDAFRKASPRLSPQAVASAWLKLFRALAVGREMAQNPLDEAMQVLPGPDSWPYIRKLLAGPVQDPREAVLRIAFDRMLGDDRALIKDCEALRNPRAALQNGGSDFQGDEISSVEMPSALRLRNAPLVSKILVAEANAQSFFFIDGVPDVVRWFGPKTAAPILKKLLEAATTSITKFNGPETRALARSITISDLSHISYPQDSLANGQDDSIYTEAIAKKLGPRKPSIATFGRTPSSRLSSRSTIWTPSCLGSPSITKTFPSKTITTLAPTWIRPTKDCSSTPYRRPSIPRVPSPFGPFTQTWRPPSGWPMKL